MLDFSENSFDWDALEKNLKVETKKKSFKDDRFWSLARDKDGKGGAIIRLVPDPNGTPYIQMYSHSIQSYDPVKKKKRWYLYDSPSTITDENDKPLPCPASELWSAVYNEGSEEGKMESRNFNRRIQFIANIKVIKDPANPDNEGKIFLWKFGTKLKDRFMSALKPSDAEIAMGEEPKQLFNVMKGNNIKLKIQNVAGFPNYDETSFAEASSIYSSIEEAKEDILNNAYKLDEFEQPEHYESYDYLLGRLNFVMETYEPKILSKERFKEVTDPILHPNKKKCETKPAPEPEPETTPEPEKVESVVSVQETLPSTESDDSLDFLEDL